MDLMITGDVQPDLRVRYTKEEGPIVDGRYHETDKKT
jgi:hypothetical protein